MPKGRKPPKPKPKQLLVEGINDRHVIWALCKHYDVPETFSVEIPNENGTEGIEIVLKGLRDKLKEKNLQTLGIVVDADQDLQSRWQAIRDRLASVGYQNIPDVPPVEGWVHEVAQFPKIGVWLMPNNQLPGMLEDFVSYLIPATDLLHPKAELVLQELERDGIQRYSVVHYPKALIHTWLAWQEKPGMPMGQAITAKVLEAESPVASLFVDWLKSLF
ncbi:DUF3226 domain-containing protein [Lusitaniella coriacea]|uniref:DUF3226 domain-containing protein n=1 Tax=Lusitaniella coriacea TaxID=1983105 RepID=UPI003CED85F9